MIRFVALAFLLLSTVPARAESEPVGLWLTQDHDGVIAIEPCGDALCGRIAGVFLDHPDDRMPVDYRGVSQCNLPLIAGARRIQPNLWKGRITHPRSGDTFGVEFRLDPRGDLALRGFFGVPLLGHTQTWTRYTGPMSPDCRLHAETGR